MKRSLLLALAAIVTMPHVAGANAPGEVDALLAAFWKASGAEAGRKHKGVYMKRQLEATGMNVTGTEERWASPPSNLLTVTTLPNMGQFRQGANARVRWAEDPINGLRVLTGVEDAEARVDATWNADLHIKKLFKTITVVPPPEGAPKEVDCLELRPHQGAAHTMCLDRTSHLRVFQKGTRATPQGPVPYVVRASDFRDVGGVKIAYRESMTAGPLTLEARVVEVRFGKSLPPSRFALPKVGRPAPRAPAPAKTD